VIDRYDRLTAELLDVVEFISDNYWHGMDPDERQRVSATLTFVAQGLPKPAAPLVD
jgi:hypothetical protein